MFFRACAGSSPARKLSWSLPPWPSPGPDTSGTEELMSKEDQDMRYREPVDPDSDLRQSGKKRKPSLVSLEAQQSKKSNMTGRHGKGQGQDDADPFLRAPSLARTPTTKKTDKTPTPHTKETPEPVTTQAPKSGTRVGGATREHQSRRPRPLRDAVPGDLPWKPTSSQT